MKLKNGNIFICFQLTSLCTYFRKHGKDFSYIFESLLACFIYLDGWISLPRGFLIICHDLRHCYFNSENFRFRTPYRLRENNTDHWSRLAFSSSHSIKPFNQSINSTKIRDLCIICDANKLTQFNLFYITPGAVRVFFNKSTEMSPDRICSKWR